VTMTDSTTDTERRLAELERRVAELESLSDERLSAVVTKRLEIVDDEGRTRVVVGDPEPGPPEYGLTIFDETGSIRLWLNTVCGQPVLNMSHGGNIVFGLGLDDDGRPVAHGLPVPPIIGEILRRLDTAGHLFTTMCDRHLEQP
jgi:hypothetical protein